MIPDNEWNTIAKKAFPKRATQAPPFLWTRILARIEAEETRRLSTWWMQWRWMSRLTVAIGLVVTVGSFYLLHDSVIPLEVALDGRSNQEHALQVANAEIPTAADSAVLVVGLDS